MIRRLITGTLVMALSRDNSLWCHVRATGCLSSLALARLLCA